MKPISFTEVLELGAPCDKVFDYMVDPETAGTIDPTIVEWRCDDQPPKVGSRNHLKAKFFGVPMKTTSRFIEVDYPHRMVIRGESPPMARWTTGVHDLEPIPGGMRYTYTVEMAPPLGFRLLHRVISRRMRKGVRIGCGRLLDVFGTPKDVT